MKSVKVCHLTSVHPAKDLRIFHKELKSLKSAGFDVSLIAPHKGELVEDEIRIIPLTITDSRVKRMSQVMWTLYKKALIVNADIYHFHDPELIPVGILLKLRGKKVIYDVHEDLPRDVMSKNWIGNRFIRKVVSKLVEIGERIPDRLFDGIVTVTPDIHKRFFNKNKTLIRNFPLVAQATGMQPFHRKSKFTFIYIGGLTRVRGITEIIEALNSLNGEAELWLLGTWESEQFQSECLDADNTVIRYFGFQPPEIVRSLLRESDVGLVVLHPEPNFLLSYPVKSFEYMQYSLPMIMSDFPLWKSMYHDCAIFVNPFNIEQLTRSMKLLMNDEGLRKRLGSKGKERVIAEFSWQNESIKLVDLYNKLAKEL